VNKLLIILLLSFCYSCGKSTFEGEFKVSIFYVHDDWPITNFEGETHEVTWFIDKLDNNEYNILVQGSESEFTGKENTEGVIEVYTEDDRSLENCKVLDYFILKFKPNNDKDKFTGSSESQTSYGKYGPNICDIGIISTITTFEGIKQ
jgi:hypothetical protein